MLGPSNMDVYGVEIYRHLLARSVAEKELSLPERFPC